MWKGIVSSALILLAAQLVYAQTTNPAWPYWGSSYGYPNYANPYPAYGNNYQNYPGYPGYSNGYSGNFNGSLGQTAQPSNSGYRYWVNSPGYSGYGNSYPGNGNPAYPERPMPQGPPTSLQGTNVPRSSASQVNEPPAQELLPPQSDTAPPMTEPIDQAPEAHFPAEPTCPRFWGGFDYLFWWVKDAPVPFPLVTTGNLAAPVPGALGQPGTLVLFGNDVDFGGLSGFRGTLGGWIDRDARCGAEVSGFVLEEGSVHFGAGSDVNGNPPLFVPVFRTDLSREGTFIISSAPLAGNINIGSTSSLWGIEGNLYRNLFRSADLDVDLLVGARYLDLREKLELSGSLTTTDEAITDVFDESFRTRNQFVGGQIGVRIGYQDGPLFATLTPKVALGSTHQVVDINGSVTESGGGLPPSTFPGAILTQPSNIGHQARDEFSVVPQVNFTVGWKIFPWARVYAGYDFLYWNRVVRPGDQINRNINATQSVFQGGVLSGPATPTPLFNTTDFYALGVSAGIQFRY